MLMTSFSAPHSRPPAGPAASGPSRAPRGAAVLRIKGEVKSLVYQNEEKGYFIARVHTAQGEVTVRGPAWRIDPGQSIVAVGSWEYSAAYGRQFKANEVVLGAPESVENMERYLASMAPGIGPAFARKVVEAFGVDKVLTVLEKEPERVRTVKGVGAKRAAALAEAFRTHIHSLERDKFFSDLGLRFKPALKRVEDYFKGEAYERLQQNPYLLTRVKGFGFLNTDARVLQANLGISRNSALRLREGVLYVLDEAAKQGSCGLPEEGAAESTRPGTPPEGLVARACQVLGAEESAVRAAIDTALERGDILRAQVDGRACYFLRSIYSAEQDVARRLLALACAPAPTELDYLDSRIVEAEVDLGVTLESSQRQAVRLALSRAVCVITGGPGTGKTTITRVVLTVLERAGFTLELAAPTGKAAKRAAEATGYPARTIHRMLGRGDAGGFKHNEQNTLETDVLVLDELSMVDVELFRGVLRALDTSAVRLILVGDVDQLPSVGPGKVLSDIIESGAVPTARLTEVFRQAKTSAIVRNAHAVNQGETPEVGWPPGSDFAYLVVDPRAHTDEARAAARESLETRLYEQVRALAQRGFDPVRDIQVLAPTRRGVLGTVALNERLRAMLNPEPRGTVSVNGTLWAVGDKVLQTKNAYERGPQGVFNGDIGYVSRIETQARRLYVEFDVGEVEYDFDDLGELQLAYALTVHKSQGSEFAAVVMPLDTSHFMLLKRNLLYTAITRARKLMVVLGSSQAMKLALANSQLDSRYSRLAALLRTPALIAEGEAQLAGASIRAA